MEKNNSCNPFEILGKPFEIKFDQISVFDIWHVFYGESPQILVQCRN